MQLNIEKRISQLRQAMVDFNLDTLLVMLEENRRYLSRFTGEDTQFDESAGVLLITSEKLILVTDSRFELQAQKESPGFQVFRYSKSLDRALTELLSDIGTRKMGFESTRMSVATLRKIQTALESADIQVDMIPADELVRNLRIKKDPGEVQSIRKALEIAEAAFEDIIGILEPGKTESRIARQFEQAMHHHGADAMSFPTIVASGPNSALPHAIPSDRIIQAGEPILFDWGAKLNGYCSDTSRTLMIGKPDRTFHEIYRTVHDAQKMAIEAIRPGVSAREVDAIARNHIEAMGFKEKFGHGLGHGVGMSVHEAPRLSPLSEDTLEAGMIVTVEPGIYIPEWGGIRLENMVWVTNGGAEILNRLPLDESVNIIER